MVVVVTAAAVIDVVVDPVTVVDAGNEVVDVASEATDVDVDVELITPTPEPEVVAQPLRATAASTITSPSRHG